jgi:DNA-binding LacI/PurR family transcriptional regulator
LTRCQPRPTTPNGQRMVGWLDALTPAGIEPIVVQHRRSGEETGRAAGALLLERSERPSAVLCVSDATAYGVRASTTAPR